MANTKGSANFRNLMSNGNNSLLPPKSPFPSITPSYTDFVPSTGLGSKPFSKSRDGNASHQRTSSESFIEEQPSWLDELLNEPETPVRRGHRRSSSDSFAYLDTASMSNIDYVPVSHDEGLFKRIVSSPLWVAQNVDHCKETLHGSLYADPKFYDKLKNQAWESKFSPTNHGSGLRSCRDSGVLYSQGSCVIAVDSIATAVAEKQDLGECGLHDTKISLEKKDGSHYKSISDDTKRAKQQFAQRSRVRKLQYIAELERNVQALQAEGSEVSAELEFLNQRNLILSIENKALKQRLESLAQEKLIKYLEHEILEREMARLRAVYQQQKQLDQQHQKQLCQRPPSSHRRTNSRDLDLQFANLSLKHKEASSGADSVGGPVRI